MKVHVTKLIIMPNTTLEKCDLVTNQQTKKINKCQMPPLPHNYLPKKNKNNSSHTNICTNLFIIFISRYNHNFPTTTKNYI